MRYTGTAYWGEPDELAEGDISVCFVRPNQTAPREITFEVEYENYDYEVSLTERNGIFAGQWVFDDGERQTGPVTVVLTRRGEDLHLSGTWKEAGESHKFNADLQKDES